MTFTIPDPVDVHVGARMLARRKQLNQSQAALADEIGVTFQQVQKYERGSNRISASMLYRTAKAQRVMPGYYFIDFEKRVDHSADRIKYALANPAVTREQMAAAS